ncbi:hypothetical protein MKX01_017885 [Papaver californicum]|nr:hypothetical protein MKX01_017885 [Papaver californicum]
MGALEDFGFDKQLLAAPIKKAVDKFQLIPEFLKVKGLVKQHLDSYNYFVNIGIKKIVRASALVQSSIDLETYMRYRNVGIGEPSFSVDTNMTYAAPITVVVECRQRVNARSCYVCPKEVVIGRMPVILRSCRCILNGRTKRSLRNSVSVHLTRVVILLLKELRRLYPCATENVYNQKQALEFLDNKVKRPLDILRDVFLANVPVGELNFCPKRIYTAVMFRRMMDAILNKDAIDDKDYVGNKRFELSGQSLLFEDYLKKHTARSLHSYITGNSITHGLERAISTGNWDLRRFRMHRTGVTQVLARLSFIASVELMTRVKPQFEKSRKVSGPRAWQPSQWGMLCPCDVPEGEACGLVKNLALMTHVTTDVEDGPLISLCHSLGVESLELISAEEIHFPNSFLVIFNGIILGKHRLPLRFATSMRNCGEQEKLGYGGRVCRPLVIADKGKSRVKERHMQELRDGVRTFSDFLHDGLIEYLDVNEHNNALIALYGEPNEEITVEPSEIEPLTILGVCAGLIPYSHHNQSPRNTYQLYPQRPLLATKTIELIGYDMLGAGQNATVAVMSYSGYDIEDAIVMNKSSLDRGFGHCVVLKKSAAIVQRYGNNTQDRICAPDRKGMNKDKMRILDDDGIAAPGKLLYKGNNGETGVIDRVALFSDINNNLCIKFQIRHTRIPEIGDKFSSRHGKKGVCRTIGQQEDSPFSKRGICPDLIMVSCQLSRDQALQFRVEPLHPHSTFPDAQHDEITDIMEFDSLNIVLSILVFLTVQVCRACGLLGYYNHKLKTGVCSSCKHGESVSKMKLPYACKLLFQELQSMNIVPRLKLTEAS